MNHKQLDRPALLLEKEDYQPLTNREQRELDNLQGIHDETRVVAYFDLPTISNNR